MRSASSKVLADYEFGFTYLHVMTNLMNMEQPNPEQGRRRRHGRTNNPTDNV